MTSQIRSTAGRRALLATAAIVLGASTAACGHLMTMIHGGPDRPAASEFGLGPRASQSGVYQVTLEPVEPLATRKLQTVRVHIRDGSGAPVDGASLTVDGGMPQHGHGLPTRPRMTQALGGGVYEIGGVRFNMGGWWEFKLDITAPVGSDRVTFNLAL